MDIRHDVPLKQLNTFGLASKAEYFTEARSVPEIEEALHYAQSRKLPLFLLGGGSNILLTHDVPGLTIHIANQGKNVTTETDEHVWLQVGAGEVWHELVLYCIANGFGGIENLSLIPGRTGAAPIQNIGAYGVELRDVFDHLEAVHIPSGETHRFESVDCAFAYRDSVFKSKFKGQYAIATITLRLDKRHHFHTEYGTIQQTLDEMGVTSLSIKTISDAVIQIRQSKLPDPKEIGNAGSFFKNPELPRHTFLQLQADHPDVPNYALADGRVKVPAAWLIDQCGWKGKRFGNAGSHAKQPLVLVNYGGAKGEDILALAMEIQQSVEDRFGIPLQAEVNIV